MAFLRVYRCPLNRGVCLIGVGTVGGGALGVAISTALFDLNSGTLDSYPLNRCVH